MKFGMLLEFTTNNYLKTIHSAQNIVDILRLSQLRNIDYSLKWKPKSGGKIPPELYIFYMKPLVNRNSASSE